MTKPTPADDKGSGARRAVDEGAGVRRVVDDLAGRSEEFLRRIENALRQPYEYASARQDYEGVLKALALVESEVRRRGVGPIDDTLARHSHDQYLTAAKQEKELLDAELNKMASAAAAARKRLAE